MRESPADPTFARFWPPCFLLNFGRGVFPPLLPQVMDGLGLGFATAGLLGTALGIARFLTELVVLRTSTRRA